MADIRLKCAETLQKIMETKSFFSELKKGFAEKDLPFANMLILTSLRYWVALNFILKKFVSKKIPHKHRLAEYLLKMAITELLFMDSAPYAVINQSVQNVKTVGDKFLGGLTNAVLRKVEEQKEILLQKVQNISLIPDNFMPLLKNYSPQEIKQISDIIPNTAPLDISVKDNPNKWQEKFKADILPNGTLRLYDAVKIQSLPEYESGQWWIQDVAATLPALIIGNITNKNVIDLCAAPGGKTAQLLAHGAKVTALDISESRLQTLKQNMARLGFNNIKALTADAIEYIKNCSEKYDAILLDAPCSATGTFRRHPEVLHIKNVDDISEQKLLQRKMLNGCAKILKKGGILVYSVCSICQEEGERQIAEFLQEHSEFKRIKITAEEISSYGKWDDKIINDKGEIRTMPYHLKSKNGMDSFFICKMQRII